MTALALFVVFFGAFIPSAIAANKGRSPIGFYLFGLLGLVPALIVVLLIPPTGDSGEAMRLRQRG